MSAPSAPDLLYAMEQAGLTVRTLSGWETRGGSWRLRNPFRATNYPNQPVAVMHHHTAPPVPYPIGGLVGSKLKANVNIKPDGTVWLLAYRACNYSSGMGSSVVLNEVLKGSVPTQNARNRGLRDNINGNPYYWNFENDHWGDGSPIPRIQLDAIVTATRVTQSHFSLPSTAVISHAEHTRRKNDPNWNGTNRAIEEIRLKLAQKESRLIGLPLTPRSDPEEWRFVQDMMNEIGWNVKGTGRPDSLTRAAVKAHLLDETGADEAGKEIDGEKVSDGGIILGNMMTDLLRTWMRSQGSIGEGGLSVEDGDKRYIRRSVPVRIEY